MFRINKKIIRKASVKITDIFFHPERKKIQAFVFCVLGATLLWFVNALSKERIEVINYPIHFVYDQKKYTTLKDFPKDIPLSIKGSGWQIMKKVLRIRVTPIRCELKNPLNNPNYILGNNLRANITKILDDVTLEGILVDTIFIAIDQRHNRTFRLAIDSSSISLKEGYRLLDPIVIYPDKVALSGPRKVLNELPDPLSLKIKTRQIGNQITERVKLNIQHQFAELISKDTESIHITISPTLFVTKKTNLIIDIANFPQNSPYSLQRDRRITEIIYSFPEKEINNIRPSDFSIFADFESLRTTDTTVSLVLKNKPDLIKNQDIYFKSRVKLDYDKK